MPGGELVLAMKVGAGVNRESVKGPLGLGGMAGGRSGGAGGGEEGGGGIDGGGIGGCACFPTST